MSPPHNLATIARPRTLAHVLLDLKEARDDLDMANVSMLACEPDAEDRANEAETRLEDLRTDFDVRLAEATGLTVEQLRAAYAEALI